ncbi:MAG: hypothetical protein M3444_10660, partial [Acidobacteriota bacterium]|nr:hypothetical protein [Acidobacteriota bacterium]
FERGDVARNARLRELAEELVLTLRAFKGLIVQNQTEERAARATHTVFLAHTEGRMRDVSRRLASELTQAEVEVVTRIPPPDEAAEHEQKVEAVLKRADLAVHLLDDAPGLEVQDDPEKFYSWEQLRLGLRHARSQLIWVPDTVKVEAVEDAGQRKLLDLLEKRDLAALEGIGFGASQDATRPAYSFVHEPKDALKRIIMDKLEEVARAAAAQDEGDSSDNSQPVAFLDLHQKDSRFAHDLGPVFIERGVEVRIVPEGDSPRSNDSRFENSLKQASIFLVIFGQVSADWVRERLNRALQIMVREKCALSLWGVYAPPIDGAPGARQFTPPTPPRGSLRPYCIDSPENLNVILKAMGVNP